MRTLPADAPQQQAWSCLPRGYRRQVRIVLPGTFQGKTYEVEGTSDVEVCEAVLRDVLDKQLEAVDSDTRQLPRQDLIALGGLELALRLALGDDTRMATGDELLAGARDVCAQDFNAQSALAPDGTPALAVAGQCETALLVALVYTVAYNNPEQRLLVEVSRLRGGTGVGFVLANAPSWPVGAPPRGVRCDELEVDLYGTSLPPLIMYQCDCVTFINYDRDGVHHISSDDLLREVMPSFSSHFLYPQKMTDMDANMYPNQYRV